MSPIPPCTAPITKHCTYQVGLAYHGRYWGSASGTQLTTHASARLHHAFGILRGGILEQEVSYTH
jgi:hypothetical protein